MQRKKNKRKKHRGKTKPIFFYQRKLSEYISRREEIRNSTTREEYMEWHKVSNLPQLIRTLQNQIRKSKVINDKIKKAMNLLSVFNGHQDDGYVGWSWELRSMEDKDSLYMLYRYCLERGINSMYVSIFLGVKNIRNQSKYVSKHRKLMILDKAKNDQYKKFCSFVKVRNGGNDIQYNSLIYEPAPK